MAVNTSRSMNTDLHLGINDGKFKSYTPDRGGVPQVEEVRSRAKVLQTQYNVVDFMTGKTVKSDNDYESGYAED